MADPLQVHLVATDREVWSGEATLVTLETLEGSVGIMPKHSPLLAMLKEAPVLIRQVDGTDVTAAVHAGFALVDDGQVIILAESAELAGEIDKSQAEKLLEQAQASETSESADAAKRRAETRLKVAGS